MNSLHTTAGIPLPHELTRYGLLEVPHNQNLTREQLVSVVRELEPKTWIEDWCYITDPGASNILLHDIFAGQCGHFSRRLENFLESEHSISSVMVTSTEAEKLHTHVYLLLGVNGEAFIVDPSIGQYLLGCKESFIGTRGELFALITNPETVLRPGLLEQVESREQLFAEIWGNYCYELGTKKTLKEAEYHAAYRLEIPLPRLTQVG